MTLLPVAPILLLPFILIFFIAVLPVWLVAMIVLIVVRGGLQLVVRRPDHPARVRMDKTFRWVKSFGGLIHLGDGVK
jgi:hypothetical protein